MMIENRQVTIEEGIEFIALDCAIRTNVIKLCCHGSLVRQVDDGYLALVRIMVECVESGIVIHDFIEFQQTVSTILELKTIYTCPHCSNPIDMNA